MPPAVLELRWWLRVHHSKYFAGFTLSFVEGAKAAGEAARPRAPMRRTTLSGERPFCGSTFP